MEKKGDVLNQIGIISDLLEKVNLDASSKTITFHVNENELARLYSVVSRKYKEKMPPVKDMFDIKVGDINIIFSTNNV